MEADFPVVDDLLSRNQDILAVSVLVDRLDNAGGIPGREEEVGVVADAFPFALVDDLLGVVVDVVDGSDLDLAFYVPEGVEDGHVAHSEAIDHLIVVHEPVLLFIEDELGLPHGGLIFAHGGVDDIVVVVDSILVQTFLLVLELVGEGRQHVFVVFDLPEVVYPQGNVVDAVLLVYGVFGLHH